MSTESQILSKTYKVFHGNFIQVQCSASTSGIIPYLMFYLFPFQIFWRHFRQLKSLVCKYNDTSLLKVLNDLNKVGIFPFLSTSLFAENVVCNVSILLLHANTGDVILHRCIISASIVLAQKGENFFTFLIIRISCEIVVFIQLTLF